MRKKGNKMIHLSKFLIGIRHKRTFRIKNLSGQLIDKLVDIHTDKFTMVNESRSGEEFLLSNDKDYLNVRINRDDIIFEHKKICDFDDPPYVEVNKKELLDITKNCITPVKEILALRRDFYRIGMIFEFRLPKWDAIKDENFGQFICENFVNFNADGENNDASVRFVYKKEAPGGGVIRQLKDFRNIIIRLDKSFGLNEKGKEEKCLFISVDIQHIFDPARDNVSIDEHYDFAYNHLTTQILPRFKAKGIEVNL